MPAFPDYPPGGGPIATIAEFDADLHTALLARRERLGAASGLEVFYDARLDRGWILNHYEIDLATLFATEFSQFEHYVEIGAGAGQLSLLLAMNGLSVFAVEARESRFACLEELRSVLGAKYPGVREARLVQSWFPAGLPDIDFSRSICFMACMVEAGAEPFEPERSILRGMQGFGAAIIDMTRFGRIRRTPETQAELVRDLRLEGYSDPVLLGAGKGWYDGMLALIRPIRQRVTGP